MADGPILVVGANGRLGGAVARRLLAEGAPVRALSRRKDKLQELAALGAEIAAVDLLDLKATTEACRGVSQIVATATNNMGKGASSPMRVDLTGYQNLCAAVRNTKVKRLIYVSFRGAAQDDFVDIFKLKWYIEDAIRRSGVPHVIVRPTALMDVWVDEMIGPAVRQDKPVLIFGSGAQVANYIGVDDVADFIVRILGKPEIVNEAIDLGGPTDISLNDLTTMVERHFGKTGKRRHIPLAMMTLLPPLLRPFNEVAARLMTMGRYVATRSRPFPAWKKTADRFGVRPKTVEEYLASRPAQ